jgi:hypothetical protein
MELHRGIVVEIQDNDSVIVLTPGGDILEVKTNGKKHEIGDQILFYERVKTQEEKHWVRRSIRYVAGLAAALLFIFCNPLPLFDSSGGKEKAYAKSRAANVYIESKSAVKVGVNKHNEVVSVEPLNKPAKRLLKELHWEGEQVGEFVENYFVAANKVGYLGPEDKAIISVDPVSKVEKENCTEIIEKELSQSHFIKENDIEVVTVTVPDVVIKKANDLRITPGKLIISLIAKATGKEIPVDVLKVAAITELVDTDPILEKALPRFTERQLEKLSQKAFASTPEDGQPTATVTTGDSKTDTVAASNPQQNVTSNPNQNVTTSEDTQPSGSSTNYMDSTESDQSASTNDSSGSNSTTSNQSEQQVEQDDSSTVSNQPATNEGQDQGQNIDNQPKDSKPNDSQSIADHPNDGQPKDNQPQDNQLTDQPIDNQLNNQPQNGQAEQPQQDQNQQGQDQPDQNTGGQTEGNQQQLNQENNGISISTLLNLVLKI